VRILLLDPDHEIADLLGDLGSPGIPVILAPVIPPRDELAVPDENSLWREQDGSGFQKVSGQLLGLRCQSDPLMIIQEDAFVPFLLLLQNPHQFPEVLDRFP